MTPAISNIAWPPHLRDAAYAALQTSAVTGLEIAPGLFLPEAEDPFEPEAPILDSALRTTESAGLTLVSMQALTFGAEGIALFGSPAERTGFETALRRAIGLAARLSVPAMVFGSPRHRRVPENMPRVEAISIAAEAFSRLAIPAAEAGTRFALEANPEAYGTNFMTDIEETLALVGEINHPAIGLNLDLGAQIMNHAVNDLEKLLDRAMDHIVHVHVSEPFLAPLSTDTGLCDRLVAALADRDYQGAISIEMRPVDDDPIGAVRIALEHLAGALRKAGQI